MGFHILVRHHGYVEMMTWKLFQYNHVIFTIIEIQHCNGLCHRWVAINHNSFFRSSSLGLPSALYPGLVMMSSNATLAPTKCAFTHLPQPPFTAPQESPSPPALAPTVAPTAVTSSGRITSSNSGASRRISTDGGMSSVGHSIDNVGGPSSVQSMNSSSDVPSSPSRHASLPPVRLSVTSDHKPLTDSSRLTHCLTGTHQQKPSHIHNIPAPVKTGISSTGPSAHYGSTHSSPSGGSPLLLPRPPSLPSGPGPSTPPGPPGPTTPPGLQASLCNHGNSPMLPDAAVSLASHLEPAAFLEANIPSFLVDSQPAVVTTASTDYPPPPPPGFRRSDALPTIPPPLTQLQQPPLASHHDMAGLHTLASGKNEGYSTGKVLYANSHPWCAEFMFGNITMYLYPL